jgi:heme-degrading monooxygenase HmoA
MAVGIRLKFDGGTQEQYEAVHEAMRVDLDPPAGLIFHSAGPIDGGWGVIDFWESREAFDAFVESRLGPTMGQLGERGMAGPPDLREFPVHHYVKV